MNTFKIPAGWSNILSSETKKPYFYSLENFLVQESLQYAIFPPAPDVFAALDLTPFNATRVLILGQDPYHDENQAHGLAFSIRPGIPLPPSLKNIFKELHDDVGALIPNNGHLIHWAGQGVLLLNTVLTVRAHQPGSHQNRGWEIFTDRIIQLLSEKPEPVVFVLWGNFAQKKVSLIDVTKNQVIVGPHPSPLSAYRGFFGSRPFSRVNVYLQEMGQSPIDWAIPNQ